MDEKLYTIPVNDAFDKDCECPICAMYNVLENDAINYTMGPSYMEDDVRAETDRLGFCKEHIRMLSEQKNKLGLALILTTHFQKTVKDVEKFGKNPMKPRSLFKKEESPILTYLDKLNGSCFVCERINRVFGRYIATVIQLYKTDAAFRKKYEGSKGFCNQHYADLLRAAQSSMSGSQFEEFVRLTTRLYLDNMNRLAEDLSWFVDKNDYRNIDAPWKNSKDAIPRAMIKSNGVLKEDTIVVSRQS